MPVTLPQLDIVKTIIERAATAAPRRVDVAGLWGSAKSVAAAQTAQELQCPMLCVAAGRIEAEAIYDDLTTFAHPDRCALFPAWEVFPWDAMAPADDIVAERIDTLQRLTAAQGRGEAMYVVTPIRALLQYVIPRDRLVGKTVSLAVGAEQDLEHLTGNLAEMGYERELMVEQRGQMSVRGGIFDVFPIACELPYRIEFFGDTIESIRRFEPETQRSVDHCEAVQITPRSEKALIADPNEAPAALTDYFPPETLVVMDEPMAIEEEVHKVADQVGDSPQFMAWADAQGRLDRFMQLSLAQVPHAPSPGAVRLTVTTGSMSGWQGNPEGFWDQLEGWDREGYTVVLLCNSTGERQRLFELLEERGYRLGSGSFDLRVELGRLRAGFSSQADALAVLSEREMFGRRYVRRVRRRFEAGEAITAFSDLRAGDYMVHAHHGIGRYVGLQRFPGKAGDFLTVQYAGADKLYVPVTHIDTVQKYIAGDGASPKIDNLGGATWARTKARVRKAVRDMTKELLQLYAARESQQGHTFSPDAPWQQEFEDAFEYEETPDQARTIIEVKRDLESPKPMDRLICGDVGYGKTEVALRAAFKSVMGSKQVAVLVPTTVLAEQHYVTFSERLADYPVAVEMLSRFRGPAQQKRTIERLKSGEVDIVIGTHRLLSKDIQFKDLGLIVVDEEQRFGVAQKEKLKQLRTLVDVLTLSATPIPRTLHMAFMGVRDMSVINTAPNDRLPIHTCIEVFDEKIITEAIERELARQGQVFFVHNRVQTILPFVDLVRRLAPTARVAVAHGQMPERELEGAMAAFVRKELDVLVCTTIIGSGLDIPNANTIIINNADQFGLSELYQLRGRVGRYKHRAFAYLLIPGERALKDEVQKRLKALEEFSALGSGFRIAMRDLEIRGCGNVLGAEQHGHIAAVGYDTYAQLVQEAVADLKGEPIQRRALPPFDVAVDASIPDDYVPWPAQKITLYKRIAGVQSLDEINDMRQELKDRFGDPPTPVRRLLDVMEVRALGAEVGAKRIVASRGTVTVELESGRSLGRKARNTLEHAFGDRLHFSWHDPPAIHLTLPTQPAPDLPTTASRLLRILLGQE